MILNNLLKNRTRYTFGEYIIFEKEFIKKTFTEFLNRTLSCIKKYQKDALLGEHDDELANICRFAIVWRKSPLHQLEFSCKNASCAKDGRQGQEERRKRQRIK